MHGEPLAEVASHGLGTFTGLELAVAGLRGLAALTNLANLAGLPRFLPGPSGLQKGQASG